MERNAAAALLLVVLAALGSPAAAQAAGEAAAVPHRIGGAKGWEAYSYTDDKDGKVCYLVGHPAKSEPVNLSRGRIDALVTHRPKEKALNVVNFDAGYPYKAGSSAELEVAGKKFSLFTDKDAAWTQDAQTDKAVTEALARAKSAVLKGTSARGTATTDIFELDGFKAALEAIDKACGVKR